MQDEALRASIGRTAKAARLRLGLSQADVAASIGIAMEVYGRLERRLMAPSVGTLRRLCVALGMSADEAFGLESSGAPVAALAPAQPESAWMRRLVRRASGLTPRCVRALALVAATMKASNPVKSPRRPPRTPQDKEHGDKAYDHRFIREACG